MIIPQFGISKRKHLPVLKLLNHSINPFLGPSVIRQFWGWKLHRVTDPNRILLATPRDTLLMSKDRAGMMLYEWATWMKYYVPSGFDFSGKTVLDVGAGEGETVALYRMLGATKFICTDIDPNRIELLRLNAITNKWSVDIYQEPFSPKFLQKKFDFMKMDCDGCETTLLGENITFPCVLETHGSDVTEAFLKKTGFYAVKRNKNTALLEHDGKSI